MTPGYLDRQDYAKVIECVPVLCVDVDLVTPAGRHALFRRCNEPLKGEWWVIGGRVHKGELAGAAAARKLREEAGLGLTLADLRFVGFYEEVFEFSGIGRGRYHTVSLVYQAVLDEAALGRIRLDEQHSEWALADRLPNGFTAKTVAGRGPL